MTTPASGPPASGPPPSPPQSDPESEAIARTRYTQLNLVRLGGIAVTMLGLLAVREVVPLPYIAALVLTVGGIATVFFAPLMMVRRWKAQDRNRSDG